MGDGQRIRHEVSGHQLPRADPASIGPAGDCPADIDLTIWCFRRNCPRAIDPQRDPDKFVVPVRTTEAQSPARLLTQIDAPGQPPELPTTSGASDGYAAWGLKMLA
jgi:hypothetical protein